MAVVRVTLALCLLAGCTKLTRSNQFDSAAPETLQAKARVASTAVLEGGGDMSTVTVVAASTGVDARRYDTTVADDGTFVLEVPGGNYILEARAPGYSPAQIALSGVQPGSQYALPAMLLQVAKGSVAGRILRVSAARDDAPAAGAGVFLTPTSGRGGYATLSGTDGSFRADGIPAGDYRVTASLAEFAPGETNNAVHVDENLQATAADIRLYPASAVVRVRADDVTGKPFVNHRDVSVELLAFVERLSEMRVSLDASFSDAASGDVSYRQFAALIPFTLADGDGKQTVYAQFRDDAGRESDVFTASITLDRGPPTVTSLVVANGASFVTADVAPLVASGVDTLSGIAGYRVAIDGALDSEPVLSAQAASSLVLALAQSFPGGDGAVGVRFAWIDGAGNESAPSALDLVKDTLAPSVVATLGTGSGTVFDAHIAVSLALSNVAPANETLSYAIANTPGVTTTAGRLPLTSTVIGHDLAPGGDGSRTVCVKIWDAAGNTRDEVCPTVALDRLGDLSATIDVEATGTEVAHFQLTSPDAQTYDADSDSAGHVSFVNVPQGLGYRLSITKTNYRTIDVNGVTVSAAAPTTLGAFNLLLLRGTLAGVAKLGDKSPTAALHGGILISDTASGSTLAAVTTPSGNWTITNVAFGTYALTASASGYVSASYGVASVTSEGTTTVNPQLNLSPESGDFAICKDALCASGAIAYAGSTSVYLRLDSPGAVGYYVSSSGTDPNVATDFTPNTSWPLIVPFTLTAGADGPRTVYVWYKIDPVTMSPRRNATVTLDTTPPAVTSVELDDGTAYTKNGAASVKLTVTATDNFSGVFQMRRSNENAIFDEAAEGFLASRNHTLTLADGSPASDGLRTVYVQVCDFVGNCTPKTDPDGTCNPACPSAPSDDITLDRLVPTGVAFQVNNGVNVTNNPQISLNITRGDADFVRYTHDQNLAFKTYEPLGTAPTTTLPYLLPSTPGSYTLYAQFKDFAGNETQAQPLAISDAIDLDVTPPANPTLAISGKLFDLTTSNAYDADGIVDLALSATGTPSHMRISNEPTFTTGTGWIAYDIVRASWALATGDGERRVYVEYRDDAGNVSARAEAAITVDTTAPVLSALEVNGGLAYSAQDEVTVATTASDATPGAGLAQVCVSKNAVDYTCVSYAGVTNYDITTALDLDATLSVKVRDKAGHESAVLQRNVKVDLTAPSLASVRIDARVPPVTGAYGADAPYAGETAVRLVISASDTHPGVASEMQVSEDPAFAGASWEPFVAQRDVTLSSANGTKTVYVRVRDAVLRVAPVDRSDSIVLDEVAPAVSDVLAYNASSQSGYTNSTGIKVRIAGTDNVSTCPQLQYAIVDGTTSQQSIDCTAQVFAAAGTFTLQSGSCSNQGSEPSYTISNPADGAKRIFVCMKDAAGRTSSSRFSDITLKATVPAAPGSFAVSSGSRVIYASWSGVSDAVLYEVETALASAGPYTLARTVASGTESVALTGLSNRVTYFVRVRARDAAGNYSPYAGPQSTLVGVGSAKLLPVLPSTSTAANSLVVGSTLWVASAERMAGPARDEIRLSHCDFNASDCRFGTSWSYTRLPLSGTALTANYVISRDVTMLATRTHFLLGVMEVDDTLSNPNGSHYQSSVYGCALTSDCSATANWSRWATPSWAGIWPTYENYTVAANGTHLFGMRTESFNVHSQVCRHADLADGTNECADGGWSEVQFTSEGYQTQQQPALLATDTSYMAMWHRRITLPSGFGRHVVRVAVCALTSGCDESTDFTRVDLQTTDDVSGGPYYGLDGFVGVATGTYVYFFWNRDVQNGSTTTSAAFGARCQLGGGACTAIGASAGQWATTAVPIFTSSGSGMVPRVRYNNRALHLTYWDSAATAIKYAVCNEPETNDCTLSASWSAAITLDSGVSALRAPDVALAEGNVFVSYIGQDAYARLRLPLVPGPISSGAAAFSNGTSQIGANWAGAVYTDGYQVVTSAVLGGVGGLASINDPLETSAQVSGNPGVDSYAVVRAQQGGEISDDTRPVLARAPLVRNVTPVASPYSVSCGSSLECASFTAVEDADYQFVSYFSGTTPTAGTRYVQRYAKAGPTTTALTWGSTNAGAGAAALLMGGRFHLFETSGTKFIHRSCTAGSCTNTPTSYVASNEVSTTRTTGYTPIHSVAYEGNRVMNAYIGDTAFPQPLRLAYCDPTTNCDAAGEWTKITVAPRPFVPTHFALAAGNSGVTVFVGYSDSWRLQRVYCSGSLPAAISCGAASDLPVFTPATGSQALSAAAGYDGVKDTTALAFEQNGKLTVAYCADGNAACTGDRYSVVAVTDAVNLTGTQLRIANGVMHVQFSTYNEVKLATCRRECFRPESWHIATLVRDGQLRAQAVSSQILSLRPSGTDPLLTTFSFVHLIDTGAAQTLRWVSDAKAAPLD